MHFAILFEDDPNHADQREAHMAAHLDFLDTNSGAILAAGPLSEEDTPAGGLWVVEAEHEAAARALVEADPFWPTGLRRSARILVWRRVFADGARLI